MSMKKQRRWCSACGSLAVGEHTASCPSCGSSRMVARPSMSATPSSLGRMAVIASALGLAACGANEEREPDASPDVVATDADQDAVAEDVAPDDDLLVQPVYGEPTDVFPDDVPTDAVYGSPPDVADDVQSDDAEEDSIPIDAYGLPPEDVSSDTDGTDSGTDVDSDIDIPMPEYGIPPEP